jgi:hypothetical protein
VLDLIPSLTKFGCQVNHAVYVGAVVFILLRLSKMNKKFEDECHVFQEQWEHKLF